MAVPHRRSLITDRIPRRNLYIPIFIEFRVESLIFFNYLPFAVFFYCRTD